MKTLNIDPIVFIKRRKMIGSSGSFLLMMKISLVEIFTSEPDPDNSFSM